MTKLRHLKPSLHRAFLRSCDRYEKLAARISGIGIAEAPDALFHRLDHLRDRMYDLAGRCHAVECAIETACNPLTDVDIDECEFANPVGTF